MAELDIGETITTDMTGQMVDYSVDAATTDAAGEGKETRYTNSNWSKQLGYFRTIPELRTAITTKATWIMGQGIKTDPQTELLLDTIRGIGKDSFKRILWNGIVVREIGGDSFAEIIRDDDGFFITLKPLDPGVMVTIVNAEGIITGYEQISKVKGKPNKPFKKEEIFHLMRERIADEIHGSSVIDVVENIILMRNEAMDDWKTVMHRFVVPRWIIKADTDNTTKLAKLKTQFDKANKDSENLIIPMGSVELEQMSISANATLNPLAWIEVLNDYFYEAVGVPKVIIGNSKNFTDASSKIVYLGFEGRARAEQLNIVEEVLSQLNLVIKLPIPITLEGGALSNRPAEDELEANAPELEQTEEAAQGKDLTAELKGGKK